MMINEDTKQNSRIDVAVIGGGLAGLTGATILAKAGCRVVLIEKSKKVGGRAISQQRGEFLFNLGPHALYIGGGGSQILDELKIPYRGHKPKVGGFTIDEEQLYLLPAAFSSLLRTRLLTFREKWQLMRALNQLQHTPPETAVDLTIAQWVTQISNSPRIKQLLIALSRLTTYANAPHELSAALFLQQIQLYFRHNVRYLDGGWQTLVDGLQQAAGTAGVTIVEGSRATAVSDDPHFPTVQLNSGQTVTARAIILAVDPSTAARLVPQNQQLAHFAATAVPVRAATLDVALRRVPRPENGFALGIDQPLYYSLHSAVAKLGPAGSGLLHVAKYLPLTQTDAAHDRQQLESLLDKLQPGWREQVVAQRFLPNMVVVNDLATAAKGGLAGRPGYAVAHSHNLYLAGDWVGPHGWLVDASLVSAQNVAKLLLAQFEARNFHNVSTIKQ